MKKGLFILLFALFQITVFAESDKDTIVTPSGLKYVQLEPGEGGPKPQDGQRVKIRFRGTLADGTIIDSNMEDAPFKFNLGEHKVIPGWEEGFKLMSEGEKGYLFIPSELAYGKKGFKSPDDPSKYIIPPDSDLIFEVELVSIK